MRLHGVVVVGLIEKVVAGRDLFSYSCTVHLVRDIVA